MENKDAKYINKLTDEEKIKIADAVEQTAVTIIITDVDGNICYTNPAFEEISGYTVEEVIGKNPRILKSGYTDEKVFDQLWNDITEGKAWQGELINKRKGDKFSLAIIDIDFFKGVNDTYGHQAGDHILNEFAEILTCSIRAYDVLGRYGGEEFMIIFHDNDKLTSYNVIKRILDNMRETYFRYEGNEINITFSCGIVDVSEFDKDRISVSSMISKADKRLYYAKENGRNSILIK